MDCSTLAQPLTMRLVCTPKQVNNIGVYNTRAHTECYGHGLPLPPPDANDCCAGAAAADCAAATAAIGADVEATEGCADVEEDSAGGAYTASTLCLTNSRS